MWDTWLNKSTLPALEQSAAFAQKRHAVLAGNIANMDVPGYKTRDLSVKDFQQALAESIQNEGASPGTAAASDSVQAQERVRDVSRNILYHDGSEVTLEEQVTQLSKNQSMHDTAIALMRSQFQTMQMAIRESAAV